MISFSSLLQFFLSPLSLSLRRRPPLPPDFPPYLISSHFSTHISPRSVLSLPLSISNERDLDLIVDLFQRPFSKLIFHFHFFRLSNFDFLKISAVFQWISSPISVMWLPSFLILQKDSIFTHFHFILIYFAVSFSVPGFAGTVRVIKMQFLSLILN